MTQSFESLLIQRASKEVFRKAKTLVRNNEIVCCHALGEGVIRAVFRDSKGVVNRVEVHGFPYGPYTASCTCEPDPHGFCCHAAAACLHHAKYTIKPREQIAEDSPAVYAGLKFTGLSDLLKQVLIQPASFVTINAESDFPHMPSKWERTILQVKMTSNGREYAGNLNNLRQLQFGKTLAVSLHLETFPQQDRQIIRYLAINAQSEGSKLSLDAEQTAEFFHCLIGFQRFMRFNEKVVIHKTPAAPALLIEDAGTGCVLRSAIIVKDVPLPLKDVKVVTGRAGCWVGMLGEYWWICAQADVLWIRSFLRTTLHPCDRKTASLLASAQGLPVKIIETRKVKITQRKFKPFYEGSLRPDGALEIELFYDYGGILCPADQERYASQGGSYWLRDTSGEAAALEKLLNFGFEKIKSSTSRRARIILRDREAIGAFVDEVIPLWLRTGVPFDMSSSLAVLCGDSSTLQISCSLENEAPGYYDIRVSLECGGLPVLWKDLSEAARRNELFMTAGENTFVRIPPRLRALASGIADVVSSVPSKTVRAAGDFSETLRIIKPAVWHWCKLADGIPGAIPNAFLRLKLDLDSALDSLDSPVKLDNSVFRGELRNYQKQGLKWLYVMGQREYNLVLADEMGLGKTIQTLALLASDAAMTLPALIICPTSLIENWAREAARFTPELKTLVISGNERKSLWEKSSGYDVSITSYSLVRRDVEFTKNLKFKYLILDEAQHIKNPETANAQTCKAILAEHRLVLTGTPLENSPEDLWSIFDFLHPGFLGSLASFRSKYVNGGTPESRAELAARISPFMLRRKKADVHKELPPKQEQALLCEMGRPQREFYDRFLEASRKLFDSFKAQGSGAMPRFEMLSALLRLRQICCAPELLPPSLIGPGGCPGSAKMDLLRELLLESIDSGHKVLLFSQFTSLLAIVRRWMEEQKLPYEYLDGSTTDRMSHVDNFNNSPGIPVFLLSLKAGGVGLNLTAADTVIIYDPWWNPAAEAQAADRTHRIGQTKPVTCIKLIVRNSIEEKVLELQKRKAALFESLVESPTEAMRHITMEDLEFLLK